MSGASEITLQVPWGTLRALAWGPEDGKKVLALHGWLDNAASFDHLIPLLPDNLRIVALDLPGHGHSDHRPKGTNYHFLDAIPDMIDVLEALKWKTCSLLGHSLGGGVSTILAATFPQQIERACLIEALGPLSNEADTMPERLTQYIEYTRQLHAKRKPVYTSVDAALEARCSIGNLSPEAARTLVLRGLKEVEGGYTWRSDLRLRLPTPRMTEAQVVAFLRRITCPVMVIRGSHGFPLPEEHWETRIKLVRNLQLHNIEGGHHLHLEHPERLAPLISDFFNESMA